MPLYEYQCQDCGNHFERIEKVSAIHDGVCPECGGAARRLLGAPALKFKGSGWYVTDYGKGNGGRPTAEKATEKPAEKTTEKTTESSSDTSKPSTSKSASKGSDSTASSKVA